jgi:hypothetical protein
MQLSREEVMVLKALRHGDQRQARLRHIDHVIATLTDQGLVAKGVTPAKLTPEGENLAAQLDRRWPE